MNPAFDSLSTISNCLLPVHVATGWFSVSPLPLWYPVVSMLLLLTVFTKKGQPPAGWAPTRIGSVVSSLIWLNLWLVSCGPVEPVEKIGAARQATDSGCDKPGCVPILAKRVPISMPLPPAAPQGLPVPTFSPQTGTMAFGTKINLSVSTLPAGAVIEYSYDNGKTWIPGDQAAVLGAEPILSRTRINDLTSNPGQATFKPFYRRVMIVGNSIMNHPPSPAQGWFNNNGMAASSPEKDFVNLLVARLAGQYPAVAYRLVSGGNFERQFSRPEYSLDEFNEPLRDFKPDLIIVRLGENVDEGDVMSPRSFESRLRLLLERFATYGGQPVKIVCTTSVWRKPQADAVIRRIAAEKGLALADLGSIVGQDQYFAFGQYTNVAVAAHPNDAGMKRIADLIWAKLP